MAYVPVQRDAGRIMYESAMQRAGTIGGAVSGLFQALNQQQQAAQAAAEAKAEESRLFNAKLKAVEALMQTHKDKFGMSEEQVKQFLSQDPNQSPKERYLRIGSFIEDSIKMSQLQKDQAQIKRLQQETEAQDRLKTVYEQMFGGKQLEGRDAPATGTTATSARTGKYRRVDVPTSALERGTGEMSLLNSLRQFAGQGDQQPQSIPGAQPFEFKLPPPSQMAPTVAQAASVATAQTAPAAAAKAPVEEEDIEETYDVPPPPIPEWLKQSQGGLGLDLQLSPEARAFARKLRDEYEASQPSEDGREPRRYFSATEDTRQPPRKTIKLDAEGIRAILSNPRVLMESFPEVVREYISPSAAQREFKGDRLDRILRQEEQLRALQEMMKPSRRRR